MKKETFARGVAILKAAFPASKSEFTLDVVDTWFALMQDLADDDYLRGITQCARSCKYLPSVADIREAALGTGQANADAQAMLAWQMVKSALKSVGYMQSVDFGGDEAIHHAVKSLGGWVAMCSSAEDEERFIRPQFLKAYAAFSRLQNQGRLPPCGPLPGAAEIYNAAHGHIEHIPTPAQISGKSAQTPAVTAPSTKALPPDVDLMTADELRLAVRELVQTTREGVKSARGCTKKG
jgi:hypothetical protein